MPATIMASRKAEKTGDVVIALIIATKATTRRLPKTTVRDLVTRNSTNAISARDLRMATRTVTGATKQRLPGKAKAGGEIAVFPPAFHICIRSLQRSLHKDRTGSRSDRVPVPLHTSVGLRKPGRYSSRF